MNVCRDLLKYVYRGLKDTFSFSFLHSSACPWDDLLKLELTECIWSHGVYTGKYLHHPGHLQYLFLKVSSSAAQEEFSIHLKFTVAAACRISCIVNAKARKTFQMGVVMGYIEWHEIESSLIRMEVTWKAFNWKLRGWGLVVVPCREFRHRCKESYLVFWN